MNKGIVIVIGLLFGIGLVFFAFYKNVDNKGDLNEYIESVQKKDFYDERILKNEKCGIQISYPENNWTAADYTVEENGKSILLQNESKISDDELGSIWITCYESRSEYFYDTANGIMDFNELDFDNQDLMTLLIAHPLLSDIDSIEFSGFSGFRAFSDGYGTSMVFFAENNGYFYTIALDFIVEEDNLSKDQELILNSIKFIE